MTEANSLKIIGLSITGIRKLSAVEMQFNGNGLIPIVGNNGHGKTTVIDSLEILFRGMNVAPKDIIQHGQTRAEIIGKLGVFDIKRVITTRSNRLEVTNGDGFQISKKPQQFLDTFFNELTFNPRPFLNKSSAQKLKFMMDLFKLDFSFQDAKIKQLEQDRLLAGREVSNCGEIALVDKVSRINVNKLFDTSKEIQESNEKRRSDHEEKKRHAVLEIVRFNDEQKERKRKIENSEECIGQAKFQKIKIQEQIKTLQTELACVESSIVVANTTLSELPEPEELKSLEVDIPQPEYANSEDINTQIKEATETNRKVDLYNQYLRKIADKKEKQGKYKTLSSSINDIRDEKRQILSQVDIPVPGLEIREDGIYHNDIFSENWSEAEGLTISSELCIAMNPKLRAIFIDKGESYDRESLKALEKWAVKNDIQVFITIVDEIPENLKLDTFYIEEGEIITENTNND